MGRFDGPSGRYIGLMLLFICCFGFLIGLTLLFICCFGFLSLSLDGLL